MIKKIIIIKSMVLFCRILSLFQHKDYLNKILLKFAQCFWRSFLNFVNLFSLFSHHSPLENDIALDLNKLETLLTKDESSLVEIGKRCQCIIPYFVIISPWKYDKPFILPNMNSLDPSGFKICPMVLEKKVFFLILTLNFPFP